MSRICRIGGVAAWTLFVYTILVMIIAFGLGGAPSSAEETFALLQENRMVGLLRLDAWTLAGMPLYYLFFAGICAALWRTDGPLAGLATALAFIGVTLFLSTPSVTSMVYLSGKYAGAVTEAQKSLYLAAGEAVIASDLWHATGPVLGGILLQGAGVVLSVLMLRGTIFGKVAAVIGILTYGLDLAHIVFGFFAPDVSVGLMIVGGTLYLVWFPVAAWKLLRSSNKPVG
ncbi:MAG: hypothetical protein WBM17_07555 [Anaerolineales bacterium]